MQSYLYSVEAVSVILTECFRWGSDSEAGGILIGPKHSRVVTHAIASTEFAERRPASYYQTEKDTQFLNQELRKHQSEGRDFLGYYHRHPGGLTSLSMGDLSTCKDILESPNYHLNNQLLMAIITETIDVRLPLFAYVVSLHHQSVVVSNVRVQLMPTRCIEEFRDFLIHPTHTEKGGQQHEADPTRFKEIKRLRRAARGGNDRQLPSGKRWRR